MKVLGLIPARYASTRFPGKPLVDIGGKSMIQRVYEQALKCGVLNDVFVATDDERIYYYVINFGGKAVMTADTHPSGTDRCAEVASQHPEYDVVINIQGDEPFIDPGQISKVAGCFDEPGTQLATLIKKINTTEELYNLSTPKVIINTYNEAIYFSRSPIPHARGVEPQQWLFHNTYYKHIGIYGYKSDVLQQITQLPVSPLEKAESLEQLRWIENGYRIKTALTDMESHAVDVPEDLEKLKY
jgi:3-deoxy-manno-octulosonate cytidylyltransferase (CMP-KDO synthetase)